VIFRMVGVLWCDWSRRKEGEAGLNVIGPVVGVLCCDWSLGRDVTKLGGAGKPRCYLLAYVSTLSNIVLMLTYTIYYYITLVFILKIKYVNPSTRDTISY